MKMAGMRVKSQAFLFLAVFISQTVMPISARPANSWLEEPKVFQKMLQAATGLPSGPVSLMRNMIPGMIAVMPAANKRPHLPFHPVSSVMIKRPRRVQISSVSYTKVVNAIKPKAIPNDLGIPSSPMKEPRPEA